MNTYKIYEINMPYIEEKLNKLNRKAAKLNCQPIILNILNTELVKTEDYIDKVYTISVTGEAPTLNNWQFIGTIEHHTNGNIIKVINNQSYPERYNTIDNTCEHCQTVRRRKNTYLVHNIETNEYKAVGKSCLKDFAGNNSIINYIELMESLLNTDWLEVFTGIPEGTGIERNLNLNTYLSHVAYHIRNTGWISRTAAKEKYENEDKYLVATCDEAINGMFPLLAKYKIYPTEQDQELANKSIEWAKTLTHDNNYLQAIQIIADEELTSYKNIGFAASIVSSYIKHIEKQIQQERKQSDYIGTPGQKIQMELTYIKSFSYDAQWGTTWIHKFIDNSGNILIWKTNNILGYYDKKGTWIYTENGSNVKVKGTIKEHNEYNNEKQTILTRCKILN